MSNHAQLHVHAMLAFMYKNVAKSYSIYMSCSVNTFAYASTVTAVWFGFTDKHTLRRRPYGHAYTVLIDSLLF